MQLCIYTIVDAQISLGYNVGMFREKLKFFEQVDYEYRLKYNGQRCMYFPVLHGITLGAPIIKGEGMEGMCMEYYYTVKGTKSNRIDVDTNTVHQYKIRLATHSMGFVYSWENFRAGFAFDISFARIKRRRGYPDDLIEKMFAWEQMFISRIFDGFCFGGTFYSVYRPPSAQRIEIRPYFNWVALKTLESYSQNALVGEIRVFRFTNFGINVNLLLRKRS